MAGERRTTLRNLLLMLAYKYVFPKGGHGPAGRLRWPKPGGVPDFLGLLAPLAPGCSKTSRNILTGNSTARPQARRLKASGDRSGAAAQPHSSQNRRMRRTTWR